MVRWHLRARSSGQGLQRPGQNDTSKARRSFTTMFRWRLAACRGELKPGDVPCCADAGPRVDRRWQVGLARRVCDICGRSRERCRLRLRWAVVRSLQQGHDDRCVHPNPRSAARSRSLRTATASESTSMRARSISTCPSRNSMPGVRDGRRACAAGHWIPVHLPAKRPTDVDGSVLVVPERK